MLLDHSNDPVMVQKNVIDSDDDLNGKDTIAYTKSVGSISEYDSTSSDEEQLSQASEFEKNLDAESQSGHTGSSESNSFNEGLHEIREVWAHNLHAEFREICHLVQKYPFVAMDTEFPGIVAKPVGNFSSADEYKYQLVKCNVDLLKLIL